MFSLEASQKWWELVLRSQRRKHFGEVDLLAHQSSFNSFRVELRLVRKRRLLSCEAEHESNSAKQDVNNFEMIGLIAQLVRVLP